MTKVEVYGLAKCSTCRKALAHLDAKRISYSFHDVKEVPVTEAQVAKWIAALGGWERLVNRAGYTWRGLAVSERASLDDSKAVAFVLRHPSLIRRPLIQTPEGISVGFSEAVRSRLG